ncbi:MAG: SDR family NAD(P)-dependent oxidoreductase, partial [Pseudomonadota bacterium]
MQKQLADQVAVVTAAGRGIGKGIALSLAAAGAQVVINSYSEATTAQTLAEVKALGVPAIALPGDITEPEQMLALRELALAEFGQIDILVNNVGAGPKSMPAAQAHELGGAAMLWDALYQQNLLPVVLMTEAVIPHMRERRSG